MRRILLPFLLVLVSLTHPLTQSLYAEVENPAHNELRALRDDLLAAVNKGDIDAMLGRMEPNVVITWQDGEVCRGKDQVKAFYARMAGSGKTFQGYKVPPTADELTTLYSGDNTGVVYGYSAGRYVIAGKEIELPNRWTATVVKENGRWLLASYHVSMNVLDNPLLTGVKRGALVTAGITLVIGLLGGWWIGRRNRAA